MAKLNFNINNEVEIPELILGLRDKRKLGSIAGFTELSYEYYLKQANTITFKVHKNNCNIWDKIRDNRLVWVKDFNEWFQITVSIDESNDTVKTVVGTSLCECELGQVNIINTEINTEEDIGRDDYKPTVFYNPDDTSSSLLHRILKKAPHYSIGHVDATLWNLQRTFSISETTIYDELMGEISEEFGCLFLFDSSTRTINAYDLLSTCNDCGYRGDYTGECPECKSNNISTGYGNDTTILVDSENLAENITLEGKSDELKNYFRVCGGDDIIDAYVAACNPTGTNYIYVLSNFDKEDMSDQLVEKLESYQSMLDGKNDEYKKLMQDIYASIEKQLELKSSMMPTIEHAETTAKQELSKITNSSLSSVAVADTDVLNKLTVYTANNAVLAMAKCLINSSVYKLTIISSRLEASSSEKKWYGKFKIVNQSDEQDYYESEKDLSCDITADYEKYVEDKIQKVIDRDDEYLVDIFSNKTSLTSFKNALKEYCLERLVSFENAYQSIIDVLVENGMADEESETYTTLYKNYYNKLCAIQSEINVRNAELDNEIKNYEALEEKKKAYNDEFNLSTYLGDELFKELCSFRREDTYKNENYISDGLTDTEIFEKAEDLLTVAKKEAVTASTLQYTLSSTLYNLLVMKEFQPIVNDFEGGNWIRVRVDDRLFRLRLIHYVIDFNNLQTLSVEFSDVLETANGLSDVQSLVSDVQSMATNFNYVAHQSSKNDKISKNISAILDDGLNAALTSIKNSDNQEIVIDNHGILCRKYDDVFDDYSGEQFKIINNLLVFTNDNWETAKSALGKIVYYDPILKQDIIDYGLLAQAVIAGVLMGNRIIGGEIYSENYVDSEDIKECAGSYINLKTGSFNFAGGKLTYNSESGELFYQGKLHIKSLSYDDEVKDELSTDLGITDKNGVNIFVTNEEFEVVVSDIDDNFSIITQTADEIKTRVEEVNTDLSDKIVETNNSTITQTAEKIETAVTQAKEDLINGKISELNTTFTQKADGIETRVESVEKDLDPTNSDGKLVKLSSRITQTESEIKSQVEESKTLKGRIDEAESNITQTANSILSTVASSQKTWDTSDLKNASGSNITISYYGYGAPSGIEPTRNYTYYLDQTNGIIYSSHNNYSWRIDNEIGLNGNLKSIEENFSTSIKQTNKSIELIQDDDGNIDLSSRISQESGSINIKTGREFIVSSGNIEINSGGGIWSKGDDIRAGISQGNIYFFTQNKDENVISIYSSVSGLLDIDTLSGFRVYLNSAEGFAIDIDEEGYIVNHLLGKAKIRNSLLVGEDIDTNGSLSVKGNLVVSGEKNRVVETENYRTVCLNAFETAEAYFSDIGSGEIANGKCRIDIEEVFSETIDLTKPYQVFITQTSEKQTSYVEKHDTYFIVHGEDGATFDWMLTAKQKDYSDIRLKTIDLDE